ncbi:hypothetical protein DITRI_Ditri06bG0079700 [Diplodiscus trichospermus]
MAVALIILTIFTFVVLVMVIGFGCLVRYGKVAPTNGGVHGFVGGTHLGDGFGRSSGRGDGGGGGC